MVTLYEQTQSIYSFVVFIRNSLVSLMCAYNKCVIILINVTYISFLTYTYFVMVEKVHKTRTTLKTPLLYSLVDTINFRETKENKSHITT